MRGSLSLERRDLGNLVLQPLEAYSLMKGRDPSLSINPGRVRSLLVIHQGALGDFILALPLLKVLRETCSNAKLVLMGFPRILELVNQRFYADQVLSIDQKGMASFFVQGGNLDGPLSQFFNSFDLLVVFGKDRDGTFMGNLKRVSAGVMLPITSFPPWTDRVHLTDHLLRELRSYGFSPTESIPKLFLTEGDRAWGRDFCMRKGLTDEERSQAIVLHPGSGSRRKVWPLERFVELAHYFVNRFDSRILVVLGPAEESGVPKLFGGSESGLDPRRLFFIKDLSLVQVGSVIQGCRLFIGNDSGLTHMAAALGLPTIAIFGPTDHRIWSPRGEKAVVVRKEMPCSPCSQERFLRCERAECLEEVRVKDVVEAIGRLDIFDLEGGEKWKRRR